MMTLVADSGSTKTAWCLTDGEHHELLMTQGINPFQQNEKEIVKLLREELLPLLSAEQIVTDVFFYGAGCTAEKIPVVASAIRQILRNETKIFVGSDMLGAARSLCGNNPGIVCILGTGSNSCYYDGVQILDNVSPLGYILGDEGSGAYIGKHLVGNVLKRQFSDHLCQLFIKETKLTTSAIIQKVYREPLPNRFLASLSPFCARHREMKEVHDFLIDCFSEFFKRNVNLYEIPELPVNFVGSVAWFYREELQETARNLGYRMGNIMQAPLEGLVNYHTQTNDII